MRAVITELRQFIFAQTLVLPINFALGPLLVDFQEVRPHQQIYEYSHNHQCQRDSVTAYVSWAFAGCTTDYMSAI